jgi:putative transposase
VLQYLYMPVRKIPLVPGEYYHIYNRGNSKQKIFLDEKDYDRFTKCLYVCNSHKNFNFRDDIVDNKIDAYDFDRGERLVSIGAWKLMPNHFHLYLTTPSPTPGVGEGGIFKEENPISKFLRKLSVSYVKYVNEKYQRTGGLFEGPFKAVHIKSDGQAMYLFSYIHLNCIKLIEPKWKEEGIKNKKKALEFLNSYKWSSYLDHKGVKRPENKIISLEDFPEYFSSIKDLNKQILDWLEYGEED